VIVARSRLGRGPFHVLRSLIHGLGLGHHPVLFAAGVLAALACVALIVLAVVVTRSRTHRQL